MNPKIQQRFFDGKGSDIGLTINDTINEIHLNLHEFILVNSCDFFEALFSFPNASKNDAIKVPDALMVRDIIASFYGIHENSTNYPQWK